jgi:3-oxoacyl-[acyl-carrier protein] reductase
MRLANKVALITGGASGFGEATAILFSEEKAKVAIADIDGAKGEEVVKRIRKEGGDAIFVQTDVSRITDVKNMIDTTLRAFGGLNILFSNAGAPLPYIKIEEIEESHWDKILSVNLKGVFLCAQCAIPIMKKQGGGVIINTASIAGARPRPGGSLVYGTSKGAVIVLTQYLALELAPYKIRVNSISPVAADTPFLTKLTAATDFAETKKAIIGTIPLGRLAEAKDVAFTALFLASDESSLITGINLFVDGGRGI